jgi:hypothetical protein
MGFTSRAAFEAALPSAPINLGFDSLAAGTIIPNGGTVGELTFHYDVLAGFGVNMMVSDVYETTSPPNFLGTDDGDVFQDGDDFEMSFDRRHAIGLSLISADPLIDDDFRLTAGGLTVGLDASAVQQTLSDGGQVFFLGIIDTTPVSSALLETSHTPGTYFFYNVDDITATAAVPEPSSLAIAAIGGLVLLGFRPHRRS